MNKLELLKLIANAPKRLKGYSELLDYVRNAYKQMTGVFPEGIDNIAVKQAAKETSENRKKVIEFPKERITDPFTPRPGKKGIEQLIKDGDVTIGTAPKTKPKDYKKIVELEEEYMLEDKARAKEFQDFSKRIRDMSPTDRVAERLKDLKNVNLSDLSGIEAQKIASEVIGRKGPFKTISNKGAKEVLGELESIIKRADAEVDLGTKLKNFDGDPDAMAQGGRIGFSGGGAGFAGNQTEQSQMQGPPVATGIMATPEGMTAEEFARANPTRQQILNLPGPVAQPPVRMQGPQMGGLNFLVPMTVGKKFPTSGGLNELRKLFGFFGAQDMGVGVDIPTSKGMITPAVSPRTGDVQVTARGRFKDGSKPKSPGRRNFIKFMAGLASLPVVGKLFKPAAKVAKTAGPAIAEGVKLGFDNFVMLVNKIKSMGKKTDAVTQKEREVGYTYQGKDGSQYELVEDLATGDVRVTKDKPGFAMSGDEAYDTIEDRSTFVLRKNQADETTKGRKPPDEYDEMKEVPSRDGTFDDIDEVDDNTVIEILEELGEAKTKKAGGGLAYMLGE